MMKGIKKIALIASALALYLFGMSSSLFMRSSGLKADADYHYTILEAGSFKETVSFDKNSNPDVTTTVSHTIECFRIKDYPTYIAVAWGEASPVLPAGETYLRFINNYVTSSKPTGSSQQYTIVAVAKNGFSRCTFQQLVLPQTVVDIREEAFAYCQSMTEFQFPKGVEIVSEGLFLDCRNLTSIYYSDVNGNQAGDNSTIKTFGSHCFDSCVKLEKIYCPSSATLFQQSCFQKCSSMTTFKFPLAIIDDKGTESTSDDEITNYLTVEEYAFADCAVLQRVYFDVNLTTIKNHAFADSKDDLEFHYYGSEANFADLDDALTAVDGTSKWRHKKITTGTDTTDPENPIDYSTTVYDVYCNELKTFELGTYPGMEFIITDQAQKLDSARTNSTTIYPIAAGGGNYAIIHEFTTPNPKPGYFTAAGELTIPNTITVDGYDQPIPVKVIDAYAFQKNSDIKIVHFNANLVQIKNHAFFHSNQITTLDFSACTNLIEIGYAIFNDIQLLSQYSNNQNNCWNDHVDGTKTMAADNTNALVSSITIPSCVQYIGNFAFYNFTRLTATNAITFGGASSSLKVIGDYAFAVYSTASVNNDYFKNYTPKTLIELPYSLSDSAAVAANFYHSFTYDKPDNNKTVNDTVFNRYAVSKNAFENQDSIYSVKMLNGGTAHDISFGSNAFVRASNIYRFEASSNICLIGNDCFKLCENMREAFLYADRAYANTSATETTWGDDYGTPTGGHIDNPWGVLDGSNAFKREIFEKQSSTYPELVVYVQTSTNNTGKYPNTGSNWHTSKAKWSNSITSTSVSDVLVKFIKGSFADNIKYWHITTDSSGTITNNSLVSFGSGPSTIDEYGNGWMSIYVNGTSNGTSTYGVAKYFTDGGDGNYAISIDFTSNTNVKNLKINCIDVAAFASNVDRNLPRYFVLPSTITAIKERAFYRNKIGYGVRVLTFDKNGTPQVYSGSSNTYAQIVSANSDANGYCCLPPSVTKIESSAFFNNRFTYVELSKDLSLFKAGAFTTSAKDGKITSWLFTDYDDSTPNDANANLTVDNGCIYYTGSATNKALIQTSTATTGTLTIANDTKAVWGYAAASSKYTGVDFNAAYLVKNGAFRYCTDLESFTNATSLKYISADPTVDADKVTISTNTVNPESTSGGAFEGCSKLNVDFPVEMTNVLKIGGSAFKSCDNLVNFTKTKTYTIYTYSSGTGFGSQVSAADANKTLDLSTLTNLESIADQSFNTAGIKYVITPNTTGTNYTQISNFSITGTPFNAGTIKLCGETISQADPAKSNGTPISQANIKAHYADKAFNQDYSKTYFRVHSADDIWAGAPDNRRYWTAIKTGDPDEVLIILLPSRTAAQNFYGTGGFDFANNGQQLDLFPES